MFSRTGPRTPFRLSCRGGAVFLGPSKSLYLGPVGIWLDSWLLALPTRSCGPLRRFFLAIASFVRTGICRFDDDRLLHNSGLICYLPNFAKRQSSPSELLSFKFPWSSGEGDRRVEALRANCPRQRLVRWVPAWSLGLIRLLCDTASPAVCTGEDNKQRPTCSMLCFSLYPGYIRISSESDCSHREFSREPFCPKTCSRSLVISLLASQRGADPTSCCFSEIFVCSKGCLFWSASKES